MEYRSYLLKDLKAERFLAVLEEIREMTSSGDLSLLCRGVLRSLMDTGGSNAGCIYLYRGNKLSLMAREGGSSICRCQMKTPGHDNPAGENESGSASPLRIPLKTGNTELGLCCLSGGQMGMPLAGDIIHELKFICSHVSVIMENFMLRDMIRSADEGIMQGQAEEMSSRHVDLARQYIEQNYFRDIDRRGIASMLNLSPDYLGKVFKHLTGKTIRQYITDERIRRCLRDLESTNTSIDEICLSAGFESRRTFFRAFRENTGMTPAGYRAHCRREPS